MAIRGLIVLLRDDEPPSFGRKFGQVSFIDSDQDRLYRTAFILPAWIVTANHMTGAANGGKVPADLKH